MKTKSLFIAVFMLLAFAGNVLAQRDITSRYITNATLSDGTNGWTKTYTKNQQTNDPADAFSNSVRGNNTVGYASEAYAGWGSLIQTAYSMKQTITLPKGHYRLVNYSFFRQGQNYDTNSSKSLAYLKAGNNQVALKTLGSIAAAGYANSQAEGANCFDSKMYRNALEFTIDTDNTAIEIGVEGTFDEAKSWCIVGMFELFDLDDLASVSSPTDVTYAITNPGFEYRNATGWTSTDCGTYANNNNFGHKAGIGFVERWQSSANGGLSNGTFTQTLTGLENGLYELAVYAQNREQYNNDADGTGMYVKANNDRTQITSSGQHKVRTKVTDGNLTIGIQLDNCSGNWIAFDRFTLAFFGDPLQAYKDLLAEKVAEAQALVDGGTLRTGAASQLQTVIDNNNNDDDAFTQEAEFNTAVANIEAGMTTANQIAAVYSTFDDYRMQFETLKTGVSSCASLTTFENAISTCNTAVSNATSVAAVTDQMPNVRAAAMTFIQNTDDHQFDITFLASQNYWDWKKKDGSNAGIVADQFLTNRPNTIPSFAESYETTCATTGTVLYQTVSDLPIGYYQVGMYAQALYTPNRGFDTNATELDANRSFAFAGDLTDNASIQRTGLPIKFGTSVAFDDLTTLDVNVHLSSSGNLTFGVTKDANGSNWHFAQIASIVYSNAPDLTSLKATRDALVSEAQGLLAGSEASMLTTVQQNALQDAIDAGEAADNFDELNTVTLTTLPNAINTAKSQIAAVKENRVLMLAALERFENDYNLADGTDYSRATMSAKAWTDLLTAVNNVTTAMDDVSLATSYGTLKDALIAQMDATDTSLRLFKSYKAMVEGTQSLSIAEGTTYAADSNMDTDATENAAIAALNTAFKTYAADQTSNINMAGFLGDNLDFNAAEGSNIVQRIYDVAGWEEVYDNVTDWSLIRNQDSDAPNVLHIRSNWTATTTTLLAQKLKMLPEGSYRLSFNWTSNKGNMTNKSVYKLGAATPVELGNNTNVATDMEYEFEVTGEATPFDLVFGFIRNAADANNHPSDIKVDNVTLLCLIVDEFKEAYDIAAAESHAATTAATTQYAANYTSEAALNGFADAAARTAAINVLRNAKTIADNSGNATSFVVNGDLMNTTLTNDTPYGWSKANEDVSGGSDVWINTQDEAQVFNYWKGTINDIEFYQVINNLPNGVYRFSVDLGTNNIPEGGAARMVAYMYCTGDLIGASEQVTTENGGDNRNFDTYSCAVDVNGNQVQIGVRSRGHYIQMKNVTLEYIGTTAANEAETDASYVRQDFFWSAGSLELDFSGTKYANAKNVVIYPTTMNQIIKAAASNQFANTTNKVVDGTCANLVITDGAPLQISTGFTATNVSYTRTMSNAWGTIILPFELTSDENVQFYSLKESDEEYMTFKKESSVEANTPVAFKKLTNEGSITITDENVAVVATNSDQNDLTTATNWRAEGSYTAQSFKEYDGIYYIASNKFWAADGTMTVNPFRAIYRYDGSSPVKSFSISVDVADAINDIVDGQPSNSRWFDLSGRQINTPQKHGVYIRDGKKTIIK